MPMPSRSCCRRTLGAVPDGGHPGGRIARISGGIRQVRRVVVTSPLVVLALGAVNDQHPLERWRSQVSMTLDQVGSARPAASVTPKAPASASWRGFRVVIG